MPTGSGNPHHQKGLLLANHTLLLVIRKRVPELLQSSEALVQLLLPVVLERQLEHREIASALDSS